MSRFSPEEREEFRGLNTYKSPTDVDRGYSPDCRNVTFVDGRVEKRAGTTVVGEAIARRVASIKEYVLLDTSQRRLLMLASDGRLYKEPGTGFFSLITDTLIEAALAPEIVFNSVTMFGREYMAFSRNGLASIVRPRQYDDTNLDPVAPEGPGAPPEVVDGAPDATFGLSAGVHKFRLFFRTRTGYWTTLSPPVSYTAPGGKLVDFSKLAIGPEWVTDRVICATPEGSDDYYFIAGSRMEIADNTSDVVIGVGWGSDAVLISGTAVSSQVDPSEDQLRLAPLAAQAGVVSYKNRLGWFGERNTIPRSNDRGFLNLTFNGGVASAVPNLPLGWTQIVAGQTVVNSSGNVGRSLRITGTGGATIAVLNNNVKPLGLIPHGVSLRARVRARRSALAGSGTVHLAMAVPSTLAGGTVNMEISAADLDQTEWRIVDGEILPKDFNFPAPEWVLRIAEGGGTLLDVGTPLAAGEYIEIDEIEIYPASDPYIHSQIRWSKVDDPESYDDLYGRQFVNENDGQDIRAMAVFRENCYVFKESSTYRISDNPDTEPSGWGSSNVSTTVGTLSPNGIGHGDGWLVVAARSGLFLFNGATYAPQPLSYEITPTWQRINWKYGYLIRVLVDTENREVYVSAPLDGATYPTHVLHLDYAGASPADAQTRDWNIWDLPASAMAFSERPDGTRATYFGLDIDSVVAYLVKLDETSYDDRAGASPQAIDSYYQTDYAGGTVGRRLFGYMTAEIDGVGTLNVYAYPVSQPSFRLATTYLDPAISYDKEWLLNIVGERVAFRFGTARLGEHWSLRKLAIFYKMHPWMKIRGMLS